MKYTEAAITDTRTCETRDELDETLKKHGITDTQEIIDFLNVCMYSPQVFYSLKPEKLEDELEFTKQVFLTRTWKINEYYERMGIKTEMAGAAQTNG